MARPLDRHHPEAIAMKPPAPTTPLSSKELARDAEKAGVEGDRMTGAGSDAHLPASEAEDLARDEQQRSPVERALTQLPPG
jgi:hypothetical protein